MNYEDNTTTYAKLFLMMIIPGFGLVFTYLLAFGKDSEGELRCLARGALIARIVFWIAVLAIGLFFLPKMMEIFSDLYDNFFTKTNIIRMFI